MKGIRYGIKSFVLYYINRNPHFSDKPSEPPASQTSEDSMGFYAKGAQTSTRVQTTIEPEKTWGRRYRAARWDKKNGPRW